jgi:NTP-dependent ternary system trypsin peptidase co-occuring protein
LEAAMKGHISIGDFIHQVKRELFEAESSERDALFELEDVTLEISFALEVEGKAGFKLYVLDLGANSKAAQSHKVTIKVRPCVGDALGGVPHLDATQKVNSPQVPSVPATGATGPKPGGGGGSRRLKFK